MKIVAMADPHYAGVFDKIKVPDGDVLVVCGDLTYKGGLEELQSVASALSEFPHKHKLVIAGNHDFCLEGRKFRDPIVNVNRKFKAEDILVDAGLTYLKDSGATIDGIKFWGAPWTPEYHSWAFNVDRDKIHAKWANIPSGLDVLMVHGPPFGYGDLTIGMERVGDSALLRAIETKKPRVVCYGHIHEDCGERHVGTTRLVNCSIGYPVYREMRQFEPVVLDIQTPNL